MVSSNGTRHKEWLFAYNGGIEMSLVAKNEPSGGDFKLVPQGTHIAVCNQIIDLGLQVTEYKGVEKIQPKCYIRWEIPAERLSYTDKNDVEHEGPMTIGKQYTVGLGDLYTMRIDFEGWRGRAFTDAEQDGFLVKNVLGTACQLSVIHKTSTATGKPYARVDSVIALPKGVAAPTAENDLFYYDDESGAYEDLPNWAKEKIGQQVAENVAPINTTGGSQDEDFDDDIPF